LREKGCLALAGKEDLPILKQSHAEGADIVLDKPPL
jgi:hypothetical protein